MLSWIGKLLGRGSAAAGADQEVDAARAAEAPSAAQWLDAEDSGNPFGIPILDLMMLQDYIATSEDLDVTARAVSWQRSIGDELDASELLELPSLECKLAYPAARSLPDGILYAPPSMDEKWVIAYHSGRVLAARSWTGIVEAVADARHDGSQLVLERLRISAGSSLRFSDRLIDTFDWLIRVHALHQRLPLPVDEDAAELLENTPLIGFSPFGKALFCAAKHWAPPEPKVKLGSDGRVIVSARKDDLASIREAVRNGADLDAPGSIGGYTALHLSIIWKRVPLFLALIELGANPDALTNSQTHPLAVAVANRAPKEILEVLARAGRNIFQKNVEGFNALHLAAQVDDSEVISWLVEHGFGLEAKNALGHTALHIACGLGYESAARALLDAGADIASKSDLGETPMDVARKHSQRKTIELLKRHLA